MIIGLGDWWGPALRARGRTSQTAKHHQCHGGRLPWSCSSVISCPGAGLAARHSSCGQISGDMTDANYTDKLNTATSHHHTMHRGVHRQYGYLYHCAGLDQHSDQRQCSGMIQNHNQLHCHSNSINAHFQALAYNNGVKNGFHGCLCLINNISMSIISYQSTTTILCMHQKCPFVHIVQLSRTTGI